MNFFDDAVLIDQIHEVTLQGIRVDVHNADSAIGGGIVPIMLGLLNAVNIDCGSTAGIVILVMLRGMRMIMTMSIMMMKGGIGSIARVHHGLGRERSDQRRWTMDVVHADLVSISVVADFADGSPDTSAAKWRRDAFLIGKG